MKTCSKRSSLKLKRHFLLHCSSLNINSAVGYFLVNEKDADVPSCQSRFPRKEDCLFVAQSGRSRVSDEFVREARREKESLVLFVCLLLEKTSL